MDILRQAIITYRDQLETRYSTVRLNEERAYADALTCHESGNKTGFRAHKDLHLQYGEQARELFKSFTQLNEILNDTDK